MCLVNTLKSTIGKVLIFVKPKNFHTLFSPFISKVYFQLLFSTIIFNALYFLVSTMYSNRSYYPSLCRTLVFLGHYTDF